MKLSTLATQSYGEYPGGPGQLTDREFTDKVMAAMNWRADTANYEGVWRTVLLAVRAARDPDLTI